MTNILPRNYEEIEPTILDPEDSYMYVDEILVFAFQTIEGVNEIIDALVEMIKRLSDQYRIFNDVQSSQILAYINRHWENSSFEVKEKMVSLLFGLANRKKSIQFLEKKLVNTADLPVLNLIKDVLKEAKS